MSLYEKITKLVDEELEHRVNSILNDYAEILSKKHGISLDVLLKDLVEIGAPVCSTVHVSLGSKKFIFDKIWYYYFSLYMRNLKNVSSVNCISVFIRDQFIKRTKYDKKKIKLIDTKKHQILTSGHPSPLSANRGYWFGNRHFSKTNEYLKNKGLEKIYW